MSDLIMSLEDFAKLTDRSIRTIKNILWSDKRDSLPPARKIGRKTIFLRTDVESWLAAQSVINKQSKPRGRPRKSSSVENEEN